MRRVKIIGVDTSTLPKLSGEEMEILLEKVKNGDERAKEDFILANFRLVLSVVKKFNGKYNSVDDLFQVGCIGLLKSVNNFDKTMETKFSTYAVPMIIGEIRRFLRDQSAVRISRGIRDIAYQCLKIKEKVNKVENREPSVEELSKWLDIPQKDITFALDAMIEPVSMFEPVFNDGKENLRIMDQVSDDKNMEERCMENIALKEAMKKLNEKERKILRMRYYIGKTQIEVSKEVGISQAQVSRLEKNALNNIKREM